MTTIWRPHWLIKHIEPVKEEVPDDDPGVVANVTRLVFENMPKDMRYSHVQKTMRL